MGIVDAALDFCGRLVDARRCLFAARVVGDLRWVGLFKRVRGTPFAWWDTWLYVPLAGLLALAALLVAINGS